MDDKGALFKNIFFTLKRGGGSPGLLPVLTSVLLILSYPKFDQGWLAWFALAPLTIALWRAKTLKRALLAGLTSGFFFYAGILYWIYPTMRAATGPAVSAFGLAALSLIMSVEFIVIAAFGFRLKKAGPGVWPYVFAAGWTLMEYGKVLLSLKAVWFPWFMLGYTQWEHVPLIQAASLTGVYGLSAAVCFSGALAGTLFVADGAPWRRALRFTPAALVFALMWGYGGRELKAAAAAAPGKYLNVALLQPAIDIYDKWDADKAGAIRRKIMTLLEDTGDAELVIWPENALTGWIDDPVYGDWLKTLSVEGRYNLVGSVSRGDARYVSAFLLDPKGEIAASYDKRRLVPFGEYVPLRGLLGKFITPVAALGEFSAGPLKQPLFELPCKGPASALGGCGVKLGAAICYESIFTYLFTADAKAGAGIFFNITNDGWYLDTAAPYQHFIVNIFRAVETRRPVLRAANNGISAVIDPWGRVLAKKDLNESGLVTAKVAVYPGQPLSFYTSRGEWFLYACLLVASAFLLAVFLV